MADSREIDLLRTYANGPKIWDATALLPAVHALADQGLIEPMTGRGGAYQLTARGREVLAENSPEEEKVQPVLAATPRTGMEITWSLDLAIEPGSVPDRPAPYSRGTTSYRVDRLRLTYHLTVKSGVPLHELSPGSAFVASQGIREAVQTGGVVLYGIRLLKSGQPGRQDVTENFYGSTDRAPDWVQDIALRAQLALATGREQKTGDGA